MAQYRVVKIDDMEAIAFGTFKRARAELDVTAFGLQILDLPAGMDAYPEHDHADDGQEEVYAALRGSAEIEIEGERVPLDPETMVRVGPGVKRKVWPGDEGIRLLVIGGCADKLYEAPDITKLGAPDPLAQQQA